MYHKLKIEKKLNLTIVGWMTIVLSMVFKSSPVESPGNVLQHATLMTIF